MDALLRASVLLPLALGCGLPASAGEPSSGREEVVAAMRPYDGPSTAGVDCSTLTGKALCGYQGWFTTPGDGSRRGWRHYPASGQFKPGFCGIDLWPDVTEDPSTFALPPNDPWSPVSAVIQPPSLSETSHPIVLTMPVRSLSSMAS